jgi:hypothetical protein
METGPNDVKLAILITGDELHELKRVTIDMVDAFGLDRQGDAYPIEFYRWDPDCPLAWDGYQPERSARLGDPIQRGRKRNTRTSEIK